jgi:guanine deaminase
LRETKVFKGDIAFSVSPEEIKVFPQSYIVLQDGIVEGVFQELPPQYKGVEVADYGSQLIMPGFADLHVHAAQIYERGLGLDLELLAWLDKYTFPEEKKFAGLQYAERAYQYFTAELIRQGTLSACLFATIHKPATELLFDMLADRGIRAFVGKVNMDRNCHDQLKEDHRTSLRETEELIQKYQGHPMVKPMITPRFVPACSGELLKGLGKLAIKYNVPVQSHLSENRQEVAWVHELHPECPDYSSVYDQYGLFGQTPTLMAHCIYLSDDEIELMVKNKVVAVHCPESNLNVASGIMPARKMLRQGIAIGLGSDVGGGHNLSMAKAIVRAIQMSKIVKLIGRHDAVNL